MNVELLETIDAFMRAIAWMMRWALPSASVGGAVYTLLIAAGYLFVTRTRCGDSDEQVQ